MIPLSAGRPLSSHGLRHSSPQRRSPFRTAPNPLSSRVVLSVEDLMPPSEFPGFQRLFDDLLRFSLSRRIPFHDAEDLVGSTIESALKHFDAAKGEFRALCFAALSNLVKNYWRDRKPGIPYPDEVGLADPDWEREFAWYRSEDEKAMLEAIMEERTEEERKFLVKLRDVFEELEVRAVSE